MKITRISCILIVILLLSTTSDATASDFMCGSRIITTGEGKDDVFKKCGEASSVKVWEERIIRDLGSGLLVVEPVTIEEWEYNLGPNRFIRYLRFENGQLINIADGDYGY